MTDGPTWTPEQIESIRHAPDLDALRTLTHGVAMTEMPEEVHAAGLEAAGRIIREQGPDAGLPEWMTGRSPGASRDAIAREFAGTGDIAGAAEGVVREGKTTYGQETPSDVYDAIKDTPLNDRWTASAANRPFVHGSGLDATRLSCYEFVHLAAGLASPSGQREGAGNTIEAVAEPGTVEEWDGESVIPAGKVVIGISAEYGEGPDDTYHFGISMGGGKLVNNRGDGPAIEDVGTVFGGIRGWRIYDKILIADYRYIRGNDPDPSPVDRTPSPNGQTTRIRNETDATIVIADGGEQVGAPLAPGQTSSALTADGPTTVAVTPENDAAETAKAIELLMSRGTHTVTPVRAGERGLEAGPPEPTAAPCCGQQILPLGLPGGFVSTPEDAARGCAANMVWWVVAAGAVIALAVAALFVVGGGGGDGEVAVEDRDTPPTDESRTEPTEESDTDPPTEPSEAATQEWTVTDPDDVARFADGSADADPLTEITSVTATRTAEGWTVDIEVTGSDQPIDEAADEYDSIAYVVEVEFADGSMTRWVWERHLGAERNGENQDDPSMPAALVTTGAQRVTFELPIRGSTVSRVTVGSFSNQEMGPDEAGPELVDQAELTVDESR